MADAPIVHIGENSPEHVALEMTRTILFQLEGKKRENTDRKEFLDTYAECLDAVRGNRSYETSATRRS
jgi:hypothetical protein